MLEYLCSINHVIALDTYHDYDGLRCQATLKPLRDIVEKVFESKTGKCMR